MVTGKVQIERRRDESGEIEDDVPDEAIERKVMLQEVTTLGDALKARARAVCVRLHPGLATDARLKALRTALTTHPGRCPVTAILRLPDGTEVTVSLPATLCVDPSEALVASVEKIFGEKVAELR